MLKEVNWPSSGEGISTAVSPSPGGRHPVAHGEQPREKGKRKIVLKPLVLRIFPIPFRGKLRLEQLHGSIKRLVRTGGKRPGVRENGCLNRASRMGSVHRSARRGKSRESSGSSTPGGRAGALHHGDSAKSPLIRESHPGGAPGRPGAGQSLRHFPLSQRVCFRAPSGLF